VATSRRQIRYEIGNIDHLTMMLLTNAKGEQGLKYILYPESVANSDPTSALSPEDQTDLISSRKADAYMDQHLLILDGHNSRLNVNTLVTAAMNNVEILCLPSHLTHLLQPNDANLLTIAILAALRQPSIPISIRASFKKVGVYPFDESRALSLCHLEEPQEDHDELVDAPSTRKFSRPLPISPISVWIMIGNRG